MSIAKALRQGFWRFLKRLRPPRAIRPTKEGWWFLLATVGLGLAATNTGNNLLYLLLAMLLSFIVISGILSEQSLRRVEVKHLFPKRIHAGEPVPARIVVRNRKKRLPSFSLHIQGSSPHYLLKLAPKEAATLKDECRFERRGLHRLPPLKVSTRYPFGLFFKTSRPGPGDEVLVYPRIVPLPPTLLKVLTSWGVQARYQKGRGSGLYDLRPFREGDDFRLIHWKTSAKAGELMLKELEREEGGKVTLLIKDPEPTASAEKVEEDISLVASLAAHFIKQDAEVRLLTTNGTIPFGRGIPHLHRILEHLALYHPGRTPNPQPPTPNPEGSNGGGIIRIKLGEGLLKGWPD